LGDLGVYGKIILKLILYKYSLRMCKNLSGSGYNPEAGCCKHGSQTSTSKKYEEFLD
jgi:hypothetical protein